MREKETKEFRVSVYRRLGYPAAGLLILAAGALRLKLGGDDSALRSAAIIVPFVALIAAYLQRILLRMNDDGLSLRWPLQGEQRVAWDTITRVRRSAAPPGRNFFIELYVSPDVSVQFNPFLFDNPDDIISELNRHLKFDMLSDNPREGEIEPGEIALAADAPPSQRPLWVLPLLACALAVIALLYFAM